MDKQYTDFLKSDLWKDLSAKCKKRDGFKCACCGEPQNLSAHHIIYPDNFQWEKTDLDMLITLCDVCHTAVHRIQECWDVHNMDNAPLTKNGYLERGNMYDFFEQLAAKIIVKVCWEKNIFKGNETSNLQRALLNVALTKAKKCRNNLSFCEEVWRQLAFVKDCYILNPHPVFNQKRRFEKTESKTRYKTKKRKTL